jgi:hypothetical protein
MACGLTLLQACSGGDAAAPLTAPSAPLVGGSPAPLAMPELWRAEPVGADTLVPGGTLVLTGRGFPLASEVSVALNDVALAISSATGERIVLQVPVGGFPCVGGSQATLSVAFPGAGAEQRRLVPWRVARAVMLTDAAPSTLSASEAACLQLPAAEHGVRYAVSVVNGAVGAQPMPSIHLWGAQPLHARAGQAPPSAAPLLAGARPPTLAIEADDDAAHAHWLRDQMQQARHTARAASVPSSVGATVRSVGALGQRWPADRGDTVAVRLLYRSCGQASTARGEVLYTGAGTVAVGDISTPLLSQYAVTIEALSEEFSTTMLPLVQRHIGDPLAMERRLGGDGRVTLLFTRFVNDTLPGTAAYVHACNLHPRAQHAASNEDAVVYLRVPGPNESAHDYLRSMRSTLVHEAKHLASFAERLAHGRDFDEPWLEEATARVAEELYARTFPGVNGWRGATGFEGSVACELRDCDGRPLVMWKHVSGLYSYLREMGEVTPFDGAIPSTNAAYAAGWSLVRWVLDQRVTSEAAALRQLVTGEVPAGLAGLSRLAGQSPADLLAQWTASLTQTALSSVAEANASWQVNDWWVGLARAFPGVYTAQPLTALSAAVRGEAASTAAPSVVASSPAPLVLPPFTGAARTLVLQAPAGPGGVLAFAAGGGVFPASARVTVQRLR